MNHKYLVPTLTPAHVIQAIHSDTECRVHCRYMFPCLLVRVRSSSLNVPWNKLISALTPIPCNSGYTVCRCLIINSYTVQLRCRGCLECVLTNIHHHHCHSSTLQCTHLQMNQLNYHSTCVLCVQDASSCSLLPSNTLLTPSLHTTDYNQFFQGAIHDQLIHKIS